MEDNGKRDWLVYISGAYSSKGLITVHQNIHEARKEAINGWNNGYAVLCPHMNTAHLEDLVDPTVRYRDFIAGDLRLLRGCDTIYMLPSWEQSTGALIEKEYAQSQGIPIAYSWNDVDTFYNKAQGHDVNQLNLDW